MTIATHRSVTVAETVSNIPWTDPDVITNEHRNHRENPRMALERLFVTFMIIQYTRYPATRSLSMKMHFTQRENPTPGTMSSASQSA